MKKKVGDYIIEELVGSGTYGEVYKGSSAKQPGATFAIKMISKKNIPEKVFKYLVHEVEMLQILNHPNVLKLIDIRATENHYYLVLEYCNGGDLGTFRKMKGGHVDEPTVKFILKQIVEGLNEVHNKNAIHRDIKPSNVLLCYPDEESKEKQRPIVKLGDFGFARLVTQLDKGKDSNTILRISSNTAPELFHKGELTFKSDIWSLGTIVYELLCGQNCYVGMTKEELMRTIDNGIYEIPKRLKLTVECLDFINSCLQLDPKQRIDWKDLLNHPFICSANGTSFDSNIFEKVNKTSNESFEHDDSFIFSSKIRYDFSAVHKFSIEVNKEIAGSKDTMDMVDADDEEFIKVDVTPESPTKIRTIESSEFIVLSKIPT